MKHNVKNRDFSLPFSFELLVCLKKISWFLHRVWIRLEVKTKHSFRPYTWWTSFSWGCSEVYLEILIVQMWPHWLPTKGNLSCQGRWLLEYRGPWLVLNTHKFYITRFKGRDQKTIRPVQEHRLGTEEGSFVLTTVFLPPLVNCITRLWIKYLNGY